MAKKKKQDTSIDKTELLGESGCIRLECNSNHCSLYITGVGTGEFSLWASNYDNASARKKTIKAANGLITHIQTFVKNLPEMRKELDTDE